MNLFDHSKPDELWQNIARAQQGDKEHDNLRKKQEKAAAASSGGFGVKDRLSPGEVWRATDFWREALLNNTRKDIQVYNKHKSSSDATNYEKIKSLNH